TTTTNALITIRSTDDGTTHVCAVAKEDFPSGSIFTEPAFVSLGDNRVVCIARDNRAGAANPALYCRSSDLGVTWSSVGFVPWLILGRNPPLLWYSVAHNLVSMIWPSRHAAYMAPG